MVNGPNCILFLYMMVLFLALFKKCFRQLIETDYTKQGELAVAL